MMTCILLPATQTVVTSWSNICHTLMEANADWWIPPEQQRLVASVVDHDMNSGNHRDSQIESLPHKTSAALTVTEFDETNDSTAVNHNNNYMVITGKENMTRRRLNLTKVTGNVVVAAPPTLPGVATTTLACANNSQHKGSLLLLPQQSMEEDENYLVEEVDDFATATEDNQDDDVGPRKNRYAAADDDSVSLF
jgi:hypothetical protein